MFAFELVEILPYTVWVLIPTDSMFEQENFVRESYFRAVLSAGGSGTDQRALFVYYIFDGWLSFQSVTRQYRPVIIKVGTDLTGIDSSR